MTTMKHKYFYYHYWDEDKNDWADESDGVALPLNSFGEYYPYTYKLWFIRNLADAPDWVEKYI